MTPICKRSAWRRGVTAHRAIGRCRRSTRRHQQFCSRLVKTRTPPTASARRSTDSSPCVSSSTGLMPSGTMARSSRALQPAPIQPVVGLRVPDGRLQRLAPLQPAPLLLAQALVAAPMDDLHAGVVGIDRFAPEPQVGYDLFDRHAGLARFALADALHLRRMQRVQLVSVMALLRADALASLEPCRQFAQRDCVVGCELRRYAFALHFAHHHAQDRAIWTSSSRPRRRTPDCGRSCTTQAGSRAHAQSWCDRPT